MKKILSIALGLLLTLGASAQSITTASNLVGGAYGNTIDTVDNTDNITKYIKVTSAWQAMSIQVVITKISGTVGGTVTLVGSNDGTNFVDISQPSVAITALRPAYTDTLTPTNQTTNTKVWVIPTQGTANVSTNIPVYAPYLYYGVKYVGTGTMSAKFRAYLVPRGK